MLPPFAKSITGYRSGVYTSPALTASLRRNMTSESPSVGADGVCTNWTGSPLTDRCFCPRKRVSEADTAADPRWLGRPASAFAGAQLAAPPLEYTVAGRVLPPARTLPDAATALPPT